MSMKKQITEENTNLHNKSTHAIAIKEWGKFTGTLLGFLSP